MRWIVFFIMLLLTVTLEMSVKSVLSINAFNRLAPSFVIVMLVFIALQAPRFNVLWAALMMGVLLDLTTPLQAPGGEPVFLIGPHALGFVVAAFAIVQMRSVVFRQRLITMIVFTFVAFLAVSVIRIMLLGVRGWFGEELVWANGSAVRELLHAILVALYSCVIALPFGWVLLKLAPIWSFHSPHQRVTAWR